MLVRMKRDIPNKINVLLVGSGGREHALAWKMRQSARLGDLWLAGATAPGLLGFGHTVDVPFDAGNPFQIQRFCERRHIGLVVIGPEDPLAAGLADALRTPERAVFGPGKDGARLEADKAWARDLLRAASVPMADGRAFKDSVRAKRFLLERSRRSFRSDMTPDFYLAPGVSQAIADERFWHDLEGRLFREGHPSESASANREAFERAFSEALASICPDQVIKASGLAKGKGVIVPDSLAQAIDAVDSMLVKRQFGAAGETIVIEERLEGVEASILALVDARTIYVLEPCQDHKRLLEGDRGPNTGGMGAFCPTQVVDDALMARIEREILVPTVDALRREGIDYRGVLYAGLMLTHAGPKVLEYNVRFGDPECQPLMARLKGDLVEILWRTATGSLDEAEIAWDPRTACCVVLASGGYPGKHRSGDEITGIEEAQAIDDVLVFQAGVSTDRTGKLVTSGGRVLGVTALAADLAAARDLANQASERIHFEGKQLRRDIGLVSVTQPVRVSHSAAPTF